MAEKSELLVSHYQSTYELTYKLWGQRNRTFLILIAVIAVATLLTFSAKDATPLLVDWIAKLLDIDDKDRIEELNKGFPFALLQGILLSVVFFLMVNLFHRALYVLRNYAYLGALEREIRTSLSINNGVAFTRESEFYWSERPKLLGTVKWFYVILLGGLLSAFVGGRLVSDFRDGAWLLVFVDLLFGIAIGTYFVGYARHSLQMDSKDAIAPGTWARELANGE